MSQPYIDFAFVKESASFERVLAHYKVPLKGTGTQRSILCPFHRETRPSCRVELDRKLFHCFACGESGNILEFVAKKEQSDLRAAAITLTEICDIPLAPPRRGDHQGPAKGTAAKERPVLGKARQRGATPAGRAEARAAEPVNPPLTFALKLDPKHPYLAERAVTPELAATFGLGFCSRGSMAGRVCIPIHNEKGELVAYAGRWAGEEVPEEVERYKLPAKFEKHRVLFNLHRINDPEHVVLVEGYWSVFRLHALGVPVAGLMGTSIAPEQLALLRERGTRFVTLLLDGDDAGKQARERALPPLADSFFVAAPLLPEGEKPDTLGEAELLTLVAHPCA
jgi:DNA primase